MQIEKVETFPLLYKLSKPYGDANGFKKYRTCFLLRITTKSGIEGWGECIDWLPTLDKGFHDRIIPFLIGKQATDRTKLVKIIKKWHQRAAAGVSMALTEIVAKKARLSICDLWGGKWHDTIPVYASFQSYSDEVNWQENSLRLIEKFISEGFSQVKLKIGGKTIQEDQQHINTVQAYFQGKISMALDANQSYDVAAARQWQPLFAEWDNLAWFEEPMPMSRTEEYKFLRQTLSVPIAGGENLSSAEQFLPMFMENAIDIVQPDTMHQDGIDGYRESLQLARQFGLRVSPHAFDGGLTRLYALFAQACLVPWSKMEGEPIEPVEWDVMENPFTNIISIRPSNGQVKVPSGVGLGVDIDLDMMEAFRWNGMTYI
ncbi:mandelate racemase/muconate lactonizing enzyme family protein [Aneurinibacillus terranovensis]|uniref:mandelate racemase/muconate lactonizing enzyme family protein n=1 Tax=Aneurinibacillus terranovensis TaxID=278991 RepID=UPI0004010972|nr:mandelate racemase/muconate lactonizing enzyme family protein [Aneurinibacillus terranovensis]